ncbi:hypothetical protein Ddye_002135 [Dipteronia dyeriana]|uniref:Phytocyanin domain-containing protein n=1 Tax=Dipteronia dyeriana TaxID=168575 RepID=A0AAD9XQF8_9ROSI|nr:hypothetical protein Ddye_002135 [Dipteronia dyeriana]
MGSCKVTILLILLSFLHLYAVTCTEFEVGGDDGWVVPKKSKDGDQMYNQWASKNRFKIDDKLHFKYNKDSVIVVTEDEYKKCRSSHPIFFSNNGDTVFTLEQPGLFYFISGVGGHCERGMKMIIKVLEPESPPQSQNQSSSPTDNNKNGAGYIRAAAIASPITFTSLFMSFLGLL